MHIRVDNSFLWPSTAVEGRGDILSYWPGVKASWSLVVTFGAR